MKKTFFAVCVSTMAIFFITGSMAANAVITPDDYSNVIKTTKKIKKLSDRGKIDLIKDYYSDNYKSFDGYGKKEAIEIYKIANEMYPDMKSKEKIKDVETKDDCIKVIIEENSKAKLKKSSNDITKAVVSGYGLKGVMQSEALVGVVYQKEDGAWKIVRDEVYKEETKINFGDAIKSDFKISTPSSINEGEEFCIKASLKLPKKRFTVGSIGHDEIVFPPEKFYDPFRAFGKDGVLERIVIANEHGKNEYASSIFAFVEPEKVTKSDKKTKQKYQTLEMSISGLGIHIKRVNMDKTGTEAL